MAGSEVGGRGPRASDPTTLRPQHRLNRRLARDARELQLCLSGLAAELPVDTSATPPALMAPANDAAFGDAIPVFDWTDATDPSGVRGYQIQISPNEEFAADTENLRASSGSSACVLYSSAKVAMPAANSATTIRR